jgi:simple sugar transport system substrate-binding protein/ribose transport system substrate-binding protein
MKNRVVRFLLVPLLLLAVAGSIFARGGRQSDNGGITIAGIVFQDDQFMNDLANGMKKAAEEEGVTLLTGNSNNDQSREVELINTYVSQKVQGICIAPLDPNTSIATLRSAAAEGIKVSTVNLALNNVNFLVGGYCSDDFANGKMVGDYAAKWIKDKFSRPIKVGLIHFDHQLPAQSQARYKGFFAGLDEANIQYTIVANQGAEREDNGLVAATDILTANPDIDIFYGANGGGLVGAVQAIDQAGKAGKAWAFGYDANAIITTLLLSNKGILQAVVVQDPYQQGYRSAKLLISGIRGQVQASGSTEAVPGFILSRDDLDAVRKYRREQGIE